MKTEAVRVARVYLTEADHQLKQIMQYLHDSEQIAGATAFRGVEFFDNSNNVLSVIEYLKEHFIVTQAISSLAEQHH
tara:strand:+ start:52278 stop:52508 length:231 start_codon:yes stop_codon:yes gene_type:complete